MRYSQLSITLIVNFVSVVGLAQTSLKSSIGHFYPIDDVAFSSDEFFMASYGIGEIKLWDVDARKEIRKWPIDGYGLKLEFIKGGKRIIVGRSLSQVSFIDIMSDSISSIKLLKKNLDDRLIDMAIDKNGNYLAMTGNVGESYDESSGKAKLQSQYLYVYSLPDFKLVVTKRIDGIIKGLCFNTNSELFIGLKEGLVVKYNLISNRFEDYGFKNTIRPWSVSFDPNSENFVTANSDNSVDLWNLNTGFVKQIAKESRLAPTLTIKNGFVLYGGTPDKRANIYDVNKGTLNKVGPHNVEVQLVEFSPSGNSFISATSAWSDVNTIYHWSTADWTKIGDFGRGFTNVEVFDATLQNMSLVLNEKYVYDWDLSKNQVIKMGQVSARWRNIYFKNRDTIYTINFERDSSIVSKINRGYTNVPSIVKGRFYNVLDSLNTIEEFRLNAFSSRFHFIDGGNKILFYDLDFTDIKKPKQVFRLYDIKAKRLKEFSGAENRITNEIFYFKNKAENIGVVSGDHVRIILVDDGKYTDIKIPKWREVVKLNESELFFTATENCFILNTSNSQISKLDFNPSILKSRYRLTNLYRRSPMISNPSLDQILFGFDKSITVLNRKTSDVTYLTGHQSDINNMKLANDTTLVTSSVDGLIKIWNLKTMNEIVELYTSGEDNWLVKSTEGLFDASARAFNELYFVNGLDIIAFYQLKSRYYEPGLLQKKLGLTDEAVRKTKRLGSTIKMPPIIKFESIDHDKGIIKVRIIDEGGGIGRVIVKINNKEAFSDVRGSSVTDTDSSILINLKLSGHPYLYENKLNEVSVAAYNEEEYILSREKVVKFIFDNGRSVGNEIKLYGLFVGVSDYNGSQIDLKYASQDAISLANAIELIGRNQFGENNVDLVRLSSNSSNRPTKENIIQYFKKVSMKAKPQDVFLIFLAGHGINYGGNEGDFYFLTEEASDGDLRDPVVRKDIAISSDELTELIKLVPALKQVLIIDACHSGQYAYDLLASSRSEKPASEIRALERIKDRTGLYVLSGSASDAVSYEASIFNQGLLTYSLLFGIKGAALREGKFVDVMNLFQFSADEVPKLAETIGGIQKPEIRVPYGAKSFDIGIVDEKVQEKVVIPSPKPLFVKSNFTNDESFNDDLRISEKLDEMLTNVQTRSGDLVFVNVNRFPNSYSLKGRYTRQNNQIKATFRLFKGDNIIESFETMGANIQSISEAIVSQVNSYFQH